MCEPKVSENNMSKFVKDEFLTSVFNKTCYRVTCADGGCLPPDDCEFAYVKTQPRVFSTKLRKAGFRKIETTVTFSMSVKNISYQKKSLPTEAKLEDAKALKKLAKNLFVADRWHADPNIDDRVARRLKECWIENYFLGARGDICIVKKSNTAIAGFLLVIKNSSSFKIDLIGVDSHFQGLGIGRQLINELSTYIGDKSLKLDVTTQLKNSQALSFYNSLGFEAQSYLETWHFHKPEVSV